MNSIDECDESVEDMTLDFILKFSKSFSQTISLLKTQVEEITFEITILRCNCNNYRLRLVGTNLLVVLQKPTVCHSVHTTFCALHNYS